MELRIVFSEKESSTNCINYGGTKTKIEFNEELFTLIG
jgi:hypothetical protein